MTTTYKFSLTAGILSAYGVLGSLLFWLHASPAELISDLAPFFAVGAIGIAALVLSPSGEPEPQTGAKAKFASLFGCNQKLNWMAMCGLGAAGFFFGAMLSQLTKALF